MTDKPALRLAVHEGIARLDLVRGDIGNPINGTFCRELYDVANALSERQDVRAVLVKAEGKAFSYGGDIAGFLPRLDALPGVMKQWTGDFHTAIARLQRLDAPIIASVHGICAGGMVAVVAGADFVLGCEATKFVAAYSGIGLACDGGASVFLTRRMGTVKATRFLILNETLDAQEAHADGLLDEIMPADGLDERAETLARQIAEGPTRAIGEIRRLLQTACDVPLETQLEREAQAMARAAGTQDAREGISAFAEKRRPNFSGH